MKRVSPPVVAPPEPGLGGVVAAWFALAAPFLGAWLQSDAAALGACVVAMAASPMVAAGWLDLPAVLLHAVLGLCLVVAMALFHPAAGGLVVPGAVYGVLAGLAVAHAVIRRRDASLLEEARKGAVEGEAQWKALAQGGAPALVTSEDGTVTRFMNDACRALLRQVEPEVDERWMTASHRAPLLAQAAADVELVDGGGQRVAVRAVLLPARWEGKVAWLWLLEDRRPAVQQRRELFKAQRLATVGQMVSGVAHELNNALTCVLNNVEYARAPDAEVTEAQHALEDAEEAARHIQALVADLRVFGRMDEGPPTAVPLQPLLDTSVRLCHASLKHAARVETDYQPVPCVMGAAQTLTAVFVGLLLHAAKACAQAPGGNNRVMTLRLKQVADKVCVEVALPEGATVSPDSSDGNALATVTAQLSTLGGHLDVVPRAGHMVMAVTLPGEQTVDSRAA